MKQELLAPAGNLEAGYAALYYGADAVYLGLQKFSARAGAENFSAQDLDTFTAYAHKLGRKVYVAINTVLQENELPQILEELDLCSRCRVDAVILQDLGVARIIRKQYPELEMHASTQMAVHNKEGALFLQKAGFSRVVVARELTLQEIKEIAAIDGLETEAFIHGALCYSYSGLCQFSAIENGRSANRGKCAYPCRACFKTDKGEKHIFSMKDMALQSDVLKMPVTSLKIEGRKKSALYVAAVTDYYRQILDGKGDDKHRAENIRQIFSRPWCKFHFNGKDKKIIDADFVGHRGLPIGKIEKTAKNRFFMTVNHRFGRYDGLQIDIPGSGKPFGFSVQNIRINGRNSFSADVNDYVEISLPPSAPVLKTGLTVYLASSTEVKSSYDYAKPKQGEFINTTTIDINVEVQPNQIKAQSGSWQAAVEGVFTPAQKLEGIKESFMAAFSKTGGTCFELGQLTLINPLNLFAPVSKMNELRRRLYEQIKPVTKKASLPRCSQPIAVNETKWIIKTDDITNLAALNLDDFAEIIVLIHQDMRPKQIAGLPKNKVRIALPAVCRRPEIYINAVNALLDAGYRKWEAANYWALSVLPLEQIDLSFDSPLYMFNTQAIEQAKEIGASRVTLAVEDTAENMNQLSARASLPLTSIVYQDVPLFTSAACIRNNDCSTCTRQEKVITIEKSNQTYMAVSKDCQIMLFNKNPLCIIEQTKDLKVSFRRMDFCYKKYQAAEVAKIAGSLQKFHNVQNSICANVNSPKI